MENLEEHAIGILTRLEEAISAMAPGAWEALVYQAHVNAWIGLCVFVAVAIITLLWGVFFLILGAVRNDGELVALGVVPQFVVSFIGALFFASCASDIIIGLTNPEAQAVLNLIARLH